MVGSGIAIRPVGPGERAAWEPLWNGYLTFYETALPKAVTDVTWARLQDPAEPMGLLGAYIAGDLRGIVHYILHRSTWSAGGYCYLQDLFVAEAARGTGLGAALITAVYDAARTAGATRVYWLTHETNAKARSLYDKVAERSGFIQYRHPV
jgi:GNAT superfamily N-acetyltransferase